MDFSAVAHDLRGPLNVMLGHMQLLSREELSERGRHRLAVVEAQVRRLMRLLDSYSEQLSAARFARVDLAAVVRNAVQSWRACSNGKASKSSRTPTAIFRRCSVTAIRCTA